MRQLLRAMLTTPVPPPGYAAITEGRATILVPEGTSATVFYNPIQQFNRDLSTLAIRAHAAMLPPKRSADGDTKPSLRILEALSATGLRAIRYALEIPHVSTVVANDLLQDAVTAIGRNAEFNQASAVAPQQGDAIAFMGLAPTPFHVVDLDPYGSAAPFLDSAVRAVTNGGLMLVTCTDLAVLAGAGFPEKCHALYGGSTLPKGAVHEGALRLVLGSIAALAARHKKAIEPLFSLLVDFYVRVAVRVVTRPIQVKNLASSSMLVYACSGCGKVTPQPMGRATPQPKGGSKFGWAKSTAPGQFCSVCGFTHHLCGPMWGGPLHDAEFIDRVVAEAEAADPAVYGTLDRIKGMLTVAKHEPETPFYFDPGHVSAVLKSQPVPVVKYVNALGWLGYETSMTHAAGGHIKTTAPWEVVLEVGKQWIVECERVLAEKMASAETEEARDKLRSGSQGTRNLTEGQAGFRVMQKDLVAMLESAERERLEKEGKVVDGKLVVKWDQGGEVGERYERLRQKGLVRFQINPRKNWGPKGKPGKE